MSDAITPTFILAVPGTQETQELPREAVLEAMARGEILPDHWVWSPEHNDWKPLAEIPELQVAPEVEAEPEPAPEVVAPVAAPIFMNGAVPAAMSAHFPPAAGQKVAEPATYSPPQPQKVQTPRLTDTQMLARTTYSQPMEIKHEFPIFKVLFVVAFLALAGIIAANYALIDQPFAQSLSTTSFAAVPAYAHLGAFTQPGALVIHVPPSNGLTADNFADFLIALAKSTPPQPFNGGPFAGVGLTSSWQSQFAFNGTDWQKLAQMDHATSDEKKLFELEHFEQLTGDPLLHIRNGEDPTSPAVVDAEAKAWQMLVANFVPKTP